MGFEVYGWSAWQWSGFGQCSEPTWSLGLGFRVSGSRLRVSRFWSRAQGQGLRVEESEIRHSGFEFGGWDLGLRIWGMGCRVEAWGLRFGDYRRALVRMVFAFARPACGVQCLGFLV